MSDYCVGCCFDFKKSCSLPALYWAYLGRHAEALAGIQRMRLPLASEARRTPAQRRGDAEVFERVSATLAAGEELAPPQGALP